MESKGKEKPVKGKIGAVVPIATDMARIQEGARLV